MGHFCSVTGRPVKENPLVSPYKHLSLWHPSAILCTYPQTKRCELFTSTDLCKLWAMRQPLPGAPNHPETATSLQPPEPATLSAPPNSLPTDHPILSSPPLLPAKLEQWPLATLSPDLHPPPTGGQAPYRNHSNLQVKSENLHPCSLPFPQTPSISHITQLPCLPAVPCVTSVPPPPSQGSEAHLHLPTMPHPAPSQRFVRQI